MNPYSDLPKAAFWRSGVQDSAPTNMAGLYQRKWPIRANENVATAGSCFAQHIARFMKKNGFSVLDMEPPPRGLPEKFAKNYGYCLYSARYGNIYTVRQLLQLIHEAEGRFVPVDPVWERGGRYFDSQRPNVEPQGLDSPDEVLAHRRVHLEALRALLRRQDIFVFTLGLTEAWIDAPTGTVYPTAPGVIAGSFDPTRHQFKNFGFNEIYADLVAVRRALRRYRPQLRILLTVSPVPLTATASGRHVLQASTYSKAVLRAVAGQFSAEHDDVDYFPSFEIITNPAAKSAFYAGNLRNVEEAGVESVMRVFFTSHGAVAENSPPSTAPAAWAAVPSEEDDAVCEEALLDAFARGRP